ncbi:kinesin-like protein KIF26A [Pteropus vampyrus]|uniref:Kinesin-like protein KIF26A n=1 Tax=Pteropus vampyrus TaxID=132908 RepID=A0A6P6BT43_PTEVA|nr:kinesin-like protein KIF26A [Pteropus vampyrus]
MALPGPPESPRGAPRKAPSLLEMGALCLDSEIILGFTSHLLRRRAKDPCLSALLPDKLPAPGVLPVCRPEVERHCDVCATHLTQLTREALRLLQAPASLEDLDTLPGGPGLMPPSPGAMTGPRDAPVPAGLAARQPGHAGPDRRKGLAWPSGPSVQVSVAPAGLGGALSTVTIQAQQCLEGMWSVSRVNSFLPPSCLAEAAVAAVAVADTVRDSAPAVGPGGTSELWGRSGACAAAPGPSAAASFFVRAAQKLSLAAKRKKPHPPPAPAARGTSTYPTDFSGVLQLWPPPAPPCLLRASSKAKDNPSSVGKALPRCPRELAGVGTQPRPGQWEDPARWTEQTRRQPHTLVLCVPGPLDPGACLTLPLPQAEVCSGTVADVLQSVVSGADGCIFSFGHTSLGMSPPSPTLRSGRRSPHGLLCPQYASSSSGGDSSCEEGHVRRPLRPFHPRPGAPDPDRLASGSPGDPDYSSGSEQSCDTVIYVGPGGAALSDRELTDGEGPPDFVPIIPALSRRPPSRGPRDADHFRCSTFAELQERLECIDGREGPAGAPDSRKTSLPDAPAPRTAAGAPLAASTAHGSPSPDSHRGALEPSKANSEQTEASSAGPEPSVPDKATGAGGRRPLPSPAPPPGQPEAGRAPAEPRGGGTDGLVRTPPVGMSGQGVQPRPPARGPLERGLLTTTVTLQQPVELNGEDELVFTVVEELSLGALAGPGRPASLASFGSDCSLQALASGSRPVSIISSVTDELDACAAQAPRGSPSSSISSWLSEVSVCTADGLGPAPSGASLDPSSPDCPAGPTPLGPPILDRSPEHRGFGSSEQDAQDSPVPVAVAAPTRPGREPRAASPRGGAAAQTIHSSLPRRPRTTSAAGRAACPCLALSPPGPRGLFEDPWLLRGDACGPFQGASAARVPSPAPVPACGRRVVDGCEVVARAAPRPEAVAQIPLLRRGATTLGVTTPATSCGDAAADAVACPGSSKTTSKKSVAPKGGLFSRPAGASPPAPPVRRSSLEHRTSPAPVPLPAGAAALRGDEEARPSSRADHSVSRATSSLKARAGKAEATYRPAPHGSLERCEGLAHSSAKAKEVAGKPARAVPRLGVPPTGPAPACRGSPAKGVGAPKPPAGGGKGRSLATGGSRALGASVKPLAPVAGRTPAGPGTGPRPAPRATPGVAAKASRGTIMGTKQALRAAHSRVNELAASGACGRDVPSWGSADSDSGYLVALERATAALEQHVNLCKAHVMMVTCFDIAVTTPATTPGPQEVDV